MLLGVTLVIAAACGLINLWLAIRVSQRRLKGHTPATDPATEQRARSHANFTEYAPFVLILMALIELARGPNLVLWALGVAFVLGRLAHPIGMDRPAPNPLRAGGIVATWIVLLGLAGWALVIGWQGDVSRPAIVIPPDAAASMPSA